MYIYNYDRETKEYLNRQIADANPEETQKQGHFVPLIPANSTLIEPPEEQPKKARVFNNGAWSYTNDYRGDYKINSDLHFRLIEKLYDEDIASSDIKTKAEKEAIEAEGLEYYKFVNSELVHKTEEEIAEEERARKDAMTLTPSDVERALLKAKNMDFDDLKALIEQEMTSVNMKALNVEFRASLFYRGATFGNGRLFDSIGALLGYTSDDMDYLFEHKELPEQE